MSNARALLVRARQALSADPNQSALSAYFSATDTATLVAEIDGYLSTTQTSQVAVLALPRKWRERTNFAGKRRQPPREEAAIKASVNACADELEAAIGEQK